MCVYMCVEVLARSHDIHTAVVMPCRYAVWRCQGHREEKTLGCIAELVDSFGRPTMHVCMTMKLYKNFAHPNG